jgi:tRNA(His) 5'-end guanylyltransferase
MKKIIEEIDKLVEKHTVALTQTHPKNVPEGLVSFDTRVVNTYELQQDLLSLFRDYIKERKPESRQGFDGNFDSMYAKAIDDFTEALEEGLK